MLGGLGIKRARDMNQAMLAKASWRILQGDEGLWSKIYRNKYLLHSSLLQNYKKPVSCSSTWASVVHGAELLKKGLKWRIGDGTKVRFWKDKWSDIGRLEDFAISRSCVIEDETVNAYWVGQMWDIARLAAVLPPEVVEIIFAIPIGSPNFEDKIIWGATPSGEFSVKSAYMLNFADDVQVAYPWMGNWSLNVPPKIKIFLWTLVAGKVLTNVQRMARNFTADSSCLHCANTPETAVHLFRDCPQARLVWGTFSIPASIFPSFSLDWKSWISANLMHKKSSAYDVPWKVVFSFICWFLWKWRCKCIFEENFNMPYDVREVILDYLEEWKAASIKVKEKCQKDNVASGWSKPAQNFFKINVDGARSNDGSIGAGGVLRNCDGAWCAGVMARLGTGEVLQAEAWVLFHGLQMGLREEVRQVQVESDSAVLVNLVLGADVSKHPLGTIVLMCRHLLEGFAVSSLKYVPRVENIVADSIAKASLSCSIGVSHLRQMPDFCREAMVADACGMGQILKVFPARPAGSSSYAVNEMAGLQESCSKEYAQGFFQTEASMKLQQGSQLAFGVQRHEEARSARQSAGLVKLQFEERDRHDAAVVDAILCRFDGNMVAASLGRRNAAGVVGVHEDAVHDYGICDQMGALSISGSCFGTEACCAAAAPVACAARRPCKNAFVQFEDVVRHDATVKIVAVQSETVVLPEGLLCTDNTAMPHCMSSNAG